MTVRVSDDSHEAWSSLADDGGTTVTALIEVLGPMMARKPKDFPMDEILRQARSVAGSRRRRR